MELLKTLLAALSVGSRLTCQLCLPSASCYFVCFACTQCVCGCSSHRSHIDSSPAIGKIHTHHKPHTTPHTHTYKRNPLLSVELINLCTLQSPLFAN